MTQWTSSQRWHDGCHEVSLGGRCTSPGCTQWLTPCISFLCPFCTLPPLLPVVGRGLVYCLRIAVFIPSPSAYLCPLFISLISLLSTFLEPSALPPHSLQCSEVDTEGKHTLNLQWPGSPSAQCASSSSSAYSKPQLASPAHLMEFLVHFGFCTTPLPTNNVFPR